jgi:hypothetical protein
MAVITSIVVAGVAAASAAGAAAAKKHAADKAAHAQSVALKGEKKILGEELGYSRVNQQAVDAERARAKERIRMQEEIDPELAQLRKLGKQQLLEEAQKPGASRESVQVAKQLFTENIQPDKGLEQLKDQIISKAQAKLSQGATLPPEFQAELVRAGVSQGAQAGLKPTQSTVGGRLYQALGSAGVALEAQRNQEAQNLAQTASGLQESRAKILSSIFPTISQSEQSQRQIAAGNFGVGEATLPQGGLTGAEAANLQINRGNTLLKIRGQQGQVKAQQALAAGEANAAYIKAGGQFVSGALGAFGGGGVGGMNVGGGEGGTAAFQGTSAQGLANLRNQYS